MPFFFVYKEKVTFPFSYIDNLLGTCSSIMYFIYYKSYSIDLYVTWMALGSYSYLCWQMNFLPVFMTQRICSYLLRGGMLKWTLWPSIIDDVVRSFVP